MSPYNVHIDMYISFSEKKNIINVGICLVLSVSNVCCILYIYVYAYDKRLYIEFIVVADDIFLSSLYIYYFFCLLCCYFCLLLCVNRCAPPPSVDVFMCSRLMRYVLGFASKCVFCMRMNE